MKRLAIIGKGTAGCYSMTHFHRWTDWEIDWYFDPNTKPQSVGEGSDLTFTLNLNKNIDFTLDQLGNFDGFYKSGIRKIGWGSGKDFFHPFFSPAPGIHFSATKFQEYIFDYMNGMPGVRLIDKNVSHADIDTDYILDCSGFSNDLNEYDMADNMAVNAVHVTQCFWDYPRFDYTLTLARRYGWVFGIPLKNRCSIGYLYNNNITSLDDVKEDVKPIFEEYGITPSEVTNSFAFKSYSRKQNFDGRVSYNGNASFFLEPLEATSLAVMEKINRWSYDVWDGAPKDRINYEYKRYLTEIENIIMSHYAAGSIYKNDFWSMAKDKGTFCYERMMRDPNYISFMNMDGDSERLGNYGTWSKKSFLINLPNLNLNAMPS